MPDRPNRIRQVVEDIPSPQRKGSAQPYERVPVDRRAAKLLFDGNKAKADRTLEILDALGAGFRINISNMSQQLKNLVQMVDPDSRGEYISYETYRKVVDIEVASAYPDLVAMERGKTPDAQMEHERIKTLMLEQAMTVSGNGPAD